MQADKSIRFTFVVRIGLSRELHPVCCLCSRVDEDSPGGVNNGQIDTEMTPGDVDERELVMNGRDMKRGFISQDPFAIRGIALKRAKIHSTAIAGNGCHTAALGPCDFPKSVSLATGKICGCLLGASGFSQLVEALSKPLDRGSGYGNGELVGLIEKIHILVVIHDQGHAARGSAGGSLGRPKGALWRRVREYSTEESSGYSAMGDSDRYHRRIRQMWIRQN